MLYETMLQELDVQELVDVIVCNESVRDRETIKRVFKEILQARIIEAKRIFNERLEYIHYIANDET